MWKEMSDEDKEPWVQAAKEDKERFGPHSTLQPAPSRTSILC